MARDKNTITGYLTCLISLGIRCGPGLNLGSHTLPFVAGTDRLRGCQVARPDVKVET